MARSAFPEGTWLSWGVSRAHSGNGIPSSAQSSSAAPIARALEITKRDVRLPFPARRRNRERLRALSTSSLGGPKLDAERPAELGAFATRLRDRVRARAPLRPERLLPLRT